MKMLSEICIGLKWTAVIAACVASAGCGSDSGSAAPENASSLPGGSWSSVAQLPDWSGNWITSREASDEVLKTNLNPTYENAPRLTPTYAALQRQSGSAVQGKEAIMIIDSALQCLPHGMPLMMAVPSPIGYEFLFTPGRVTILNEEGEARRIYTDGRPHNVDADATFSGESIGHWEGETLVVDTVAIKPKAMLMLNVVHSTEKTHVVERIRLKDKKTLEIDTTIDDPVVLSTPWHYRLTFDRSSSGFMEYVCTENNREHGGELDLTPPQ